MGRDSSSSGNYVYKRRWYCCQCGEGPLNYKLVTHCPNPNCRYQHRRCDECEVIKVKVAITH